MNHKKISLMLVAPLASTAAWGLSAADALRELGRAEGRYEAACLTPPTMAANCPALFKAVTNAAIALGVAQGAEGKQEARPAPTPAKVPADIEEKVGELIVGAQKVQTDMDKLRAKRDGLYETMDKARDLAMGVNTGSLHGPEAIEDAAAMPDKVRDIRRQIRETQKDADKVVSQALLLRQCGPSGGSNCEDRGKMYLAGKDALDKVTKSAEDIGKKVDELKRDAREIAAAEAGLDTQERAAYVKFDEGVETLPNARSLLGDNAIGLVASKEDAQVALQVGYDIKKGLLGRNRVSFHMTAPLGAGAKRADVFNNVDGLSSQGSIGFGYGMARANPLGDGLYRAMFGATLSRKTHQYLVDNAGQVEQGEQKVKPWRVGVEVEYALFGAKGTAHRVAVFHERKWQDGKAGVHCPGGAASTAMVSCLSGFLGAPKQVEGTTASYAYHFRFHNGMAMAPRLSYDSATKASGLDVPIYLIVSKEKKTELNAGIQVGWTRKPGKDGEPAQNDFGFGLFVGAPFGLLSGGGINSR